MLPLISEILLCLLAAAVVGFLIAWFLRMRPGGGADGGGGPAPRHRTDRGAALRALDAPRAPGPAHGGGQGATRDGRGDGRAPPALRGPGGAPGDDVRAGPAPHAAGRRCRPDAHRAEARDPGRKRRAELTPGQRDHRRWPRSVPRTPRRSTDAGGARRARRPVDRPPAARRAGRGRGGAEEPSGPDGGPGPAARPPRDELRGDPASLTRMVDLSPIEHRLEGLTAAVEDLRNRPVQPPSPALPSARPGLRSSSGTT